MPKFKDVPNSVYELKDQVVKQYFSNLVNAKFKILFYEKAKKSKGRVVLAYIKMTSSLEKFLSPDDYDYILFIDENIWNITDKTPKDRERLIRHELRHCFVDIEAKQPYKLVGHDFEDFTEEVKLNSDDPTWASRLIMQLEDE